MRSAGWKLAGVGGGWGGGGGGGGALALGCIRYPQLGEPNILAATNEKVRQGARLFSSRISLLAETGVAWPGVAWRGLAWPGVAWRGVEGLVS